MQKVKTLGLVAALFLSATMAFGQAERVRIVNHTNKSGVKPVAGDQVSADFYVYLKDSIIQTTRTEGQPAEFALPTPEQLGGQPMPAIIKAIVGMSVGDSVSTFELIEGMAQPLPPSFQGEKELRIDVALHKVVSAAELAAIQAKKMAAAEGVKARAPQVETQMKGWLEKFAAKTYGDAIKTTASGLQYVVFEPGTGAKITKGEKLGVHYYGCLQSAKRFDDSFSRGEPIEFPVGQGAVIQGWDEGLMLLNHGAKAIFFIPTKLAYDQNSPSPDIPAGADLVFYVEVQ